MDSIYFPTINITITTLNRQRLIGHAVEKALRQNYPSDRFTVTVIDDGSTDDTEAALQPFMNEKNFCYIKLRNNINTYQAKNLAILVNDYDAITFHDSDDVPHENKINIQQRLLFAHSIKLSSADPRAINGDRVKDPEIAISACQSIYPDGTSYIKHSPLSLFSDIFPQAVLPNINKANMIAPINPSLFKKSLFERIGGYMSAPVSSDRELQARIVLTDTAIAFSEEGLYTKFKYTDSLTVAKETNNNSETRLKIHEEIHERIKNLHELRNQGFPDTNHVEVIDIPGLEIETISNPGILTFNDNIATSEATRNALSHLRRS